LCGAGNVISIFVIIGKCACFKFLPKIKMSQFDLSTETDIAG